MSRILWVEDDFDRLRGLVNPLQSKGIEVNGVTDFDSACLLLEGKEIFDLFLIGLILPTGSMYFAEKIPYAYNGLNLIHLIRNHYHLWTPVIIVTVVRDPAILQIARNLGIFRMVWKGSLLPSEFAQIVTEGLKYGDTISIGKAIKDDDPSPIWNNTVEAALCNLSSSDRMAQLLGIQSAKYIGGPEIVRELARLLQNSPLEGDQETYNLAMEALSYIRSQGWHERPSFVVGKVQLNISVGNIHAQGSQLGVASYLGEMTQIGTKTFTQVMQEMTKRVEQEASLGIQERQTLKSCLKEFEEGVQKKTLNKIEAVTLLDRIKKRAPWLRDHFLAFTEGALASAAGAGIVAAIKLVFGIT